MGSESVNMDLMAQLLEASRAPKSIDILMVGSLQKDGKQCCDETQLKSLLGGTLVFDRHNWCDRALWHHSIVLHLFWRQTDIRISRDFR